jgi:hypothetical protein
VIADKKRNYNNSRPWLQFPQVMLSLFHIVALESQYQRRFTPSTSKVLERRFDIIIIIIIKLSL